MGQAKNRGTFEERAAASKASTRALFPESVTCNHCKQQISEIEPMDVRGIPGMRLAGGAICSSCTYTTWILDGTPEAVAAMQKIMNAEHSSPAEVGSERKPQQPS
jgi:hypothetical protein